MWHSLCFPCTWSSVYRSVCVPFCHIILPLWLPICRQLDTMLSQFHPPLIFRTFRPKLRVNINLILIPVVRRGCFLKGSPTKNLHTFLTATSYLHVQPIIRIFYYHNIITWCVQITEFLVLKCQNCLFTQAFSCPNAFHRELCFQALIIHCHLLCRNTPTSTNFHT
jgi:hypothetical protein